jgi:hypothetical protein
LNLIVARIVVVTRRLLVLIMGVVIVVVMGFVGIMTVFLILWGDVISWYDCLVKRVVVVVHR